MSPWPCIPCWLEVLIHQDCGTRWLAPCWVCVGEPAVYKITIYQGHELHKGLRLSRQGESQPSASSDQGDTQNVAHAMGAWTNR